MEIVSRILRRRGVRAGEGREGRMAGERGGRSQRGGGGTLSEEKILNDEVRTKKESGVL